MCHSNLFRTSKGLLFEHDKTQWIPFYIYWGEGKKLNVSLEPWCGLQCTVIKTEHRAATLCGRLSWIQLTAHQEKYCNPFWKRLKTSFSLFLEHSGVFRAHFLKSSFCVTDNILNFTILNKAEKVLICIPSHASKFLIYTRFRNWLESNFLFNFFFCLLLTEFPRLFWDRLLMGQSR